MLFVLALFVWIAVSIPATLFFGRAMAVVTANRRQAERRRTDAERAPVASP